MQDPVQTQEKPKEVEFEGFEDIQHHVDSWEPLSKTDTRHERMGGLSNIIWKVTAKSQEIEPKAVIYRRFGSGSAIVDRDRENYVIKGLSDKGIAPKYLGGDGEHRVEEFRDSGLMKPTDLNDKKNRRKLTRLVAQLHNVDFEKLEKTPSFLRILNGNDFTEAFHKKRGDKIFKPVERNLLKNIAKLTAKEETDFLKSIAPEVEESVVFSHNDLHSQNVLILEQDKSFQLIDYEYSEYNYRGYDIANLFNETMFEYDTEEAPHYKIDESKYPSDKELMDFIKYYLFFFKFDKEDFDLEAILKHDSYRDEYVRKNHDVEAFNKEAEKIFEEVRVCAMFSHYFWSLWGIIMSYNGDIEFDYVHYAEKRLELYQKLKEKYLKDHPQKSQESQDQP